MILEKAILIFIWLFSMNSMAQNFVQSSMAAKKGESLKSIYEKLYVPSPICLREVKASNTDLLVDQIFEKVTIVYLPSEDLCQRKFVHEADTLVLNQIFEEEKKKEIHDLKDKKLEFDGEVNFRFLLGASGITMNGENKSNGSKLQLIAKFGVSVDISTDFKTKDALHSFSYKYKKVEFKLPANQVLNGRIKDLNKLGYQYQREWKKMHLGFNLGFGTDFFHENISNVLHLIRSNEVRVGGSIGYRLYGSDLLSIFLEAQGGYDIVASDSGFSATGGFYYVGKLNGIYRRSDGFFIESSITHDSSFNETITFDQELFDTTYVIGIGYTF